MSVKLNEEIERQIESRVRAGKYQSADDVMRVALQALSQDEARAQFEPGEWDRLLAASETGEPDLEADAVFAELRTLRSKSEHR